jgi:hypothetical protein
MCEARCYDCVCTSRAPIGGLHNVQAIGVVREVGLSCDGILWVPVRHGLGRYSYFAEYVTWISRLYFWCRQLYFFVFLFLQQKRMAALPVVYLVTVLRHIHTTTVALRVTYVWKWNLFASCNYAVSRKKPYRVFSELLKLVLLLWITCSWYIAAYKASITYCVLVNSISYLQLCNKMFVTIFIIT